MKTTYSFFFLLVAFIAFSSLRFEKTEEGDCGATLGPRKSAGPPSCYSGEPPLNMTCAVAGCHDGSALNSGGASLTITLGAADSGYMPGQTYTGTIILSRPGLVRGGFQMVALQNSDITTTPGAINSVNSARTLIINNSNPHSGGCATQNKTWIEHTSASIDEVNNDAVGWQFTWQAPANPVGDVTFYVSAVDADKDLENTGDHVYTISKTVSSLISGVDEVDAANKISIYPNPASNIIQFKFAEEMKQLKDGSITITNTLGQTVLQSPVTNSISVSHLPKGMYVVRVVSDSKNYELPFIKE